MKYIKCPGVRNQILIVIALTLLLAMIQIIPPVSAEESMTTYCYRDNRSLGSVVVFDISTAATACNNVYYECKGKCIACYHDFDYVDYVCVDISGRTFLR
jgi:hypothetical protein